MPEVKLSVFMQDGEPCVAVLPEGSFIVGVVDEDFVHAVAEESEWNDILPYQASGITVVAYDDGFAARAAHNALRILNPDVPMSWAEVDGVGYLTIQEPDPIDPDCSWILVDDRIAPGSLGEGIRTANGDEFVPSAEREAILGAADAPSGPGA